MRHQTNFLKICFPPSLGSIILPTATKQFLFKILFFGSWTLPFVTAKRILALSIFNTKPPLKIKMGDMLGSVCHTVFYRMHFGFHLHISAMLLSSFCWKSWLRSPLSHCTNTWGSHCLQDMSYTCRHDVFVLESPTSTCMLSLASLQILPSVIWRAAVCPPQRPFNKQ